MAKETLKLTDELVSPLYQAVRDAAAREEGVAKELAPTDPEAGSEDPAGKREILERLLVANGLAAQVIYETYAVLTTPETFDVTAMVEAKLGLEKETLVQLATEALGKSKLLLVLQRLIGEKVDAKHQNQLGLLNDGFLMSLVRKATEKSPEKTPASAATPEAAASEA